MSNPEMKPDEDGYIEPDEAELDEEVNKICPNCRATMEITEVWFEGDFYSTFVDLCPNCGFMEVM